MIVEGGLVNVTHDHPVSRPGDLDYATVTEVPQVNRPGLPPGSRPLSL